MGKCVSVRACASAHVCVCVCEYVCNDAYSSMRLDAETKSTWRPQWNM